MENIEHTYNNRWLCSCNMVPGFNDKHHICTAKEFNGMSLEFILIDALIKNGLIMTCNKSFWSFEFKKMFWRYLMKKSPNGGYDIVEMRTIQANSLYELLLKLDMDGFIWEEPQVPSFDGLN